MTKTIKVEMDNKSIIKDSHPESFHDLSISKGLPGYFGAMEDENGNTPNALVLTIHKIKFNNNECDFEDHGSATIAFTKEDALHLIELLKVYTAQL